MEVKRIAAGHLTIEHWKVVKHLEIEHMEVSHLKFEHQKVEHLDVENLEVEHLEAEHIEVKHVCSLCSFQKGKVTSLFIIQREREQKEIPSEHH